MDTITDSQALDFHRTESGFIVSDGSKLSRTGVQVYMAGELGDGFADLEPTERVRLLRPAEEVFSPESLESLRGLPLTIDHPAGQVDSANVGGLVVGHIGDNVTQAGDHVEARVYVTHESGVQAVDRGLRQLSIGYEYELDRTPGTTDAGEAYDGIQRKIRGNHVSLVSRGRCGPSCRVQDGATDCDCQPTEGTDMTAKLTSIDCQGISVEVTEQGRQAFDAMKASHSDALEAKDGQIAAKDSKITELEAENATLSAKLEDSAKALEAAEAKSDPKALADAAAEIGAVITSAEKLSPGIKTEGLDALAIKRATLEALDIDLDGRGDAWVDASFDTRAELVGDGDADRAARQLGDAHKTASDGPTDSRAAYMARQTAASQRQEA